jgi:hypothetical protein
MIPSHTLGSITAQAAAQHRAEEHAPDKHADDY